VFSAKTNTEKLYFTYLPAFLKDLLESDCFIIYFIYCLFLETYYIPWLCYKFFFLFIPYPWICFVLSFASDPLTRLIYSLFILLEKRLPLLNLQMISITEIRITALNWIELS